MRLLSYWRRHRFLAAAVVSTMALGIGAATAVYAVVETVILRALPAREPERLVWMWNARVERDRAPFSALDLADYRDQNQVLEGVAPFINWTANLTGIGDAERLEGIKVDASFFDVLGVKARLGRTFAKADERSQVAVLTERLWRRRFGGDAAIVGQTVSLNGVAHSIVGVLPPGFVFPFRDAELAVPLSIDTDPRRSDRAAGFLRVVARLAPDVSIASAKVDLDAIGARLRRDYPDTNAKKLGVNLFPLDREIVGDARALLLTLLAAVSLLLLVACANIANLLLASLSSRRREIGLRRALGATRSRVAVHLLGEVAILVGIGGLFGLLLGRSLARILVSWGGASLPRLENLGLTPGVIAFAVVTTACAAVVCGVLPAWLFSTEPAASLNDDGRTSSGTAAQGRLRRTFVAVQVAAGLTLLVATVLTVKSFNRLQAVNPGFGAANVLSVQLALPPVRYSKPIDVITFADKLRDSVTRLAGVRDAAAVSLLPLSGLLNTQDYRIVGQPEPPANEVPQAHYRIVTPGYFRVMGIRVVGREFDDTDREATRRVAVVSRTFVDRHWPGGSPIGEHVLVGRDALEIVGISDDVKQFALEASATADLYIPLRQMPPNQTQFVAARMYWVVSGVGDPLHVAEAVRAEVRHLDKDIAASSTRTIEQLIVASVGSRRFNTDVIAIAGVSSLLLSLIGVYSVTAFSMTRRTREIGIRITLGARPSQLVRSMLVSECTPVVVGLLVGTAGAAFVSRILASILFATNGVEPALIVPAAAFFGLAALIASYVPVRRATQSDPVAALKE